MKKLLQSWKLWTWLFILVFIMTCWLLIYAASSRDFTSFKTTTMWNTLTSQNWNNLMDSLNEYTVPQWAVMAFNLEKCPDWWTRFAEADGRFIMGGDRLSDHTYETIWDCKPGYEIIYRNWSRTICESTAKGGNNEINLTINQLPPHSFYTVIERGLYAKNTQWNYDWPSNKKNWWVNSHSRWERNGDGNERYSIEVTNWKTIDVQANAWKTNTLWYGEAINIQNPYIKLLYCQKM